MVGSRMWCGVLDTESVDSDSSWEMEVVAESLLTRFLR